MRVFVWEYLAGGAWPEETLEGSLAVEGKSMLLALMADVARAAGVRVVTTWDRRLGAFPLEESSNVTARVVSSPDEEREQFAACLEACDAAFVIAPEFGGILEERVRLVESAGVPFAGCSAEAVALCGDKLLVSQRLAERKIPAVPTREVSEAGEIAQEEFPAVIKPRYGAGSQQTFVVRNRPESAAALAEFAARREFGPPIVQPFIEGESLSVAALVSRESRGIEVLPVAEQHLSNDGRFRYLGGRVPVRAERQREVEGFIENVCGCVEGLGGYVGFDLVLPTEENTGPVLVEINPRLTTGYLGYRRLATENLAERMLFPERFAGRITWKDGGVRFFPDGNVEVSAGCP